MPGGGKLSNNCKCLGQKTSQLVLVLITGNTLKTKFVVGWEWEPYIRFISVRRSILCLANF